MHMIRSPLGWLVVAAMALGPALGAVPAQAAVNVSFDNPAGYTDAGLRYGARTAADEPTMRAIRAHLEQLGQHYLRPNQVLKVGVLDIDLAGRFEPWHRRAYDVRIMRDVTWPRMKLRYVLNQDGKVLAQGEETIRDMNYLTRSDLRYADGTLRYEKAMLDNWFRDRFVKGRTAGS